MNADENTRKPMTVIQQYNREQLALVQPISWQFWCQPEFKEMTPSTSGTPRVENILQATARAEFCMNSDCSQNKIRRNMPLLTSASTKFVSFMSTVRRTHAETTKNSCLGRNRATSLISAKRCVPTPRFTRLLRVTGEIFARAKQE